MAAKSKSSQATPKKKSVSKAAAKPPAKAARSAAAAGPQVGDAAPDFKLQDDTGATVSLSGFRGKKVILYFYPKDMTTGCTVEACDFRELLPKLTKSGAVVLGVSADSVDSHRKFKEKEKLNFSLISDPARKALEAYGVWQEKSLYGRKFMGIVRTTFVIDEAGKIARVFPKVRVDGHVAEVLAGL